VAGFFGQTSLTLRTLRRSGPPEIEAVELPVGLVNQPYSVQLQAREGTPHYRWTLFNGQLPDGLTLASDGTITGKPEMSGTKTFTAILIDAAGRSTQRVFNMQIQTGSSVALPLLIDVPLLANGQFQVKFKTQPGENYWIESSLDLITWSVLLTTNAIVSSISFLDSDTQARPSRFYRVHTGNPSGSITTTSAAVRVRRRAVTN
jgi:hypothetical protein